MKCIAKVNIMFFLSVKEKNTIIEVYTIKVINGSMKLLWFVVWSSLVLPLVWTAFLEMISMLLIFQKSWAQ